MKINSKKLSEFLKSQNCEPIFKRFHEENNGFLKAGNLQIYGNYRKDNGVYSGQIVDFSTLQQSVDCGDKVQVKIVESTTFYENIYHNGTFLKFDKKRQAKSLADIMQNFKPTLPAILEVSN